MQDINSNIDIGQFGGQKGTGTEHMIVCFVDRILQLLDTHPDKSVVIASCLDWSAAFDRQDPTLAISKFIKLGVRSSLIQFLLKRLLIFLIYVLLITIIDLLLTSRPVSSSYFNSFYSY